VYGQVEGFGERNYEHSIPV